MTINIQPVTDRLDIAVVTALANEIWTQHYTPIIGERQVEYMLEKYQSFEAIQSQIADGYEYYFATINDEPAGYICLIPNEPPGKMKLSKIYVKATSRGTGLGSALLGFTKTQAEKTKTKTIHLTVNRNNTQTIDWYKKKGFAITDEIKKDIGSGFYMDDYAMEWTR